MLSATYRVTANTISSNFADLYSHTATHFNLILRLPIKLGYYLFCFALFGICLFSTQPIEAAEDETTDTPRSPSFSEQTQSPALTTSQNFGFDDVYLLALNLDIPGNIKIVAIDSNVEDKDTISVTLEKRVLQHHPILTKTFLENISLTGTKEDGTLQLNSQLPEDAFKVILEGQSEFAVKKHLHLNYIINTPPDIAVQLKVIDGEIFLHHLRGKIEINSDTGSVHLDETVGNYHIELKKGRIHGKLLLAPGQNDIKTYNGSIDLTVLDSFAAPLDLTALGGGIRLLLPNNYAADVELKSEKQRYIINLPSEIDNNMGVLNEGGPLLRLTTTDVISVFPDPRTRNLPERTKPDVSEETPPIELVQPIPQTAQSPVIDGNLSETVWLNAAVLSAFQSPTGTETAENQTDVYLMWDKENLYIGVRAHIQDTQIPRVSQTQLDSPIWEDESVEILLDMNPETEPYSHLIVNPIGGLFDQWVTKEGFPNFRFAPTGVEREQVNDSTEQFKGDSSWNSHAKVATQINANFWSFEIAIPRKYERKHEVSTWLFNIHRKAQVKSVIGEDLNPSVQHEYSYWAPMYDEEYPWWPHWKEGMGKLKLSADPSHTSETFKVTENFKVTAVEIEGNKIIPTEVVLEQIPIAPGNIFTNEQLSRLIAELETFDWFEEVQLKTIVPKNDAPKSLPIDLHGAPLKDAESDGSGDSKIENLPKTEPVKVNVQISVTEAPVKFASQIKINGHRSFPAQFIKNWFDLSPGYFADTNIKLKQQMIADFYVNRGFPFAKVTREFVNDVLQYHVNEGYLDEIQFTGNRRISRSELKSALNINTKEVYFHSLGQTRINQLRKELSKNNEAFKSIRDWRVQREGGKNILIVDIEEEPFIKPGWYPIVGFSRVHGLVLGAGGTLSTHFTGEEQLFGSISGGFSSKILNYSLGVEKSFFRRFPLAMGVGFFKLTDVSSNTYRLLPAETNLGAAVYGTALEDYYQRKGEQIWVAQTFGASSLLRLEFTQEDHDNLSKSTDWSYLDRNRIKRGNPRIDRGYLKMISLGYTFDTRDKKSTIKRPQNFGSHLFLWPNERTRRGWRGHLGIELAGGSLGGEWTFNFYKFELVRYTPLFGAHHLNIRLSGDYSDAPLPRQRLLYLGGATTLRGYDFNTFAGDKRILLNIEYRFLQETRFNTDIDAVFGWALIAFFDTGQTWQSTENTFSDFSVNEFKSSVGVGISFFISPPAGFQPLSGSVEIAVPLTVEYSLRTPRLILRLERMF